MLKLSQTIDIDPDLDISYFETCKIKANVSGAPTSVSLQLETLNGDGLGYWNYYVDGKANSDAITKNMSFDVAEGKYISSNIYPDDIYPEIYFLQSSVTWNNIPLLMSARRSNYHLMHFSNPFTMSASSSFFIEINADPVSSVNSADLDVYLVEKGKVASFFNADWRNSSDLELVASFGKNAAKHHIHSANSAHHLVRLATNEDGTIGSNNLDISDDFWIILYSNSPNSNRGWNLAYQVGDSCMNADNRWYIGNQSSWGG